MMGKGRGEGGANFCEGSIGVRLTAEEKVPSFLLLPISTWLVFSLMTGRGREEEEEAAPG